MTEADKQRQDLLKRAEMMRKKTLEDEKSKSPKSKSPKQKPKRSPRKQKSPKPKSRKKETTELSEASSWSEKGSKKSNEKEVEVNEN